MLGSHLVASSGKYTLVPPENHEADAALPIGRYFKNGSKKTWQQTLDLITWTNASQVSSNISCPIFLNQSTN